MIRKGDIVQILPQFRDPGDEEFTWMALADEEKGRVDIQPINIGMKIKPIYTLNSEQVSVVSGDAGRTAGIGG